MTRSPLRETLVPCLIIVAAAFLLLSGTFGYQWTYDDLPVVVENPDIRSLSAFLENRQPGRPLRELTYLLDYRLFGLEPSGWHIQNILWHGLNAAFLFLLACRTGAGRFAAFGAALLFLAHPVTVEVTANVSHRKDSLALAFCLLAVLAYARFLDSLPRRWGWLATAAAAWGVALAAKQNALVLPAVLIAWELAFVPEAERLLTRSRRVLVVGTGLLAAGTVGWYIHLLTSAEFAVAVRNALVKMEGYGDWTVGAYVRLVLKSWSFSLGKLLWPLSLAPEYTFPAPASWLDPWIVATLLALGCLGGLLWYGLRRQPLLFFGLAWAVAFFLPTSNIAGHTAYFAADRYLYAPLAGIVLTLAVPLAALARTKRQMAVATVAALVVTLAFLSWRQSQVWRTQESLYHHILQVSPLSLVGLTGMANVELARGELDKALSLFSDALRRAPDDPMIITNIGSIHYRRGTVEESTAWFRRALATRPGYVEALINLGAACDDLGRTGEAVDALTKALALNPRSEKALTNLGVLRERQGRLPEAEELHRRAIAQLPGYGDAHYNLGVVLFRREKLAEASDSFAEAARLMPRNADALLNLGVTRAKLGDRSGATALLPALKGLEPGAARRLEEALAEGEK
ncbi:MAG: tetratricopeptide repeat protein [Desulfuromonadales bacterium]|nr:MAG: tetratricopeptide repeat protein [Desulfuromonadales bacterium]